MRVWHKDQLHIINQKINEVINLMEPIRLDQHDYPPEIKNLWKILFDKKGSNFSFNKMAIEIDGLLCKGNGLTTSTIKNYYLRKTTPRKKTVEAFNLG